ncbi:MAG: TerB family tellurite resistance protein [Parvularculaceae bacterium]|nr:TerB family tellurite resistance protein [Parvularculaceae bacterium]
MRNALPVTGAYLAVAFADGRYDTSEENRFLATIANRPELACVSTMALQSAYNDLVEDFRRDYSATRKRVLEAIAVVREDVKVAEAVKVAARGAIVADMKVNLQEEFVLNEIAKALGLSAGAV